MMRRQLSIFLIVGMLTVLIDFLCYRGLLFFDLLDVHLAKGVSFVSGMVFAYFANRHWTFQDQGSARRSLWRFVLLYVCTLSANIGINALVLQLAGNLSFAISLAFLLATASSALLNFIGMKLFVFQQHHSQACR